MLKYASLLGLGELIAVTFAAWLGNYLGISLQAALYAIAMILFFIALFGFLFAGSSGMLQGRGSQPWNPYYAKEVARTIREDQPSRFRATLVLLLLGAVTWAIGFIL